MDWSQHSLGWNLEEGKVQFLRQTNFGGGLEWMLMIGNYSAAKLSSRNNFGYFGFGEEGSQVISQWRADFVHKAVIQPKPSPHWRGLPRKHLIKAPAHIIYSQNLLEFKSLRKLPEISISCNSKVWEKQKKRWILVYLLLSFQHCCCHQAKIQRQRNRETTIKTLKWNFGRISPSNHLDRLFSFETQLAKTAQINTIFVFRRI